MAVSGGSRRLAWCLRRVGATSGWLLLESGMQVTVGRGLGTTYQLWSKACPLMISCKHCIFQEDAEGQWTVQDNQSLTGVWLNEERLDASKAYPIAEGDRIRLGVAWENNETAEYEYEVMREEWVKIRPFLAQKNDVGKAQSSRTKRKLSWEELEASGLEGPSTAKWRREERICDPVHSSPLEYSEKAVSVPPEEKKCSFPAWIWTGLKILKTILAKGSAVLYTKQEHSHCLQKILELRRNFCQEILELKRGLQELQELHKQLWAEQQHRQRQEVEKLEKTSSEELQRLLCEHRALVEELSRKTKELEETKEEKEKVRAETEELLNHITDVLETELRCAVCLWPLFQTVTLNCAHSFCSYCINEWTKRKMECPLCRQEIKSKTRSLVLDNCVDRLLEKADVAMKEQRLTLIRERKAREKQNVGETSHR